MCESICLLPWPRRPERPLARHQGEVRTQHHRRRAWRRSGRVDIRFRGVQACDDGGREARLRLEPDADPRAAMRAVLDRVEVSSMRLDEPRIEDIYLETVGAAEPTAMSPSLVFKIARREFLARVQEPRVRPDDRFGAGVSRHVHARDAAARPIEQQRAPDCRAGRRNRTRRRARRTPAGNRAPAHHRDRDVVDRGRRRGGQSAVQRGDSRSNARRLSDASSAPMRRRREPATLRGKRATRC